MLAFTLVAPALMRRRDEAVLAEQVRRAAIAGLPPAVFFTVVWSFLFLPQLDARERVALAIVGFGAFVLALAWDRSARRGA